MKLPLKQTTTLIYPELNEKTNSEIFEFLQKGSDILTEIWKTQDFGIYTHPEYIKEAFISYYKVTHKSIYGIKKYFKDNNLNPSDYTVFEIYNGIGLSTLQFVDMGFNVEVLNDNPEQISVMKTLFDFYGLEIPKIVTSYGNKHYDIVCCLEVTEHFKDPIEFTKSLLSIVDEYYIEATGFSVPTYPGHFYEYTCNGQLKTHRQAGREVTKVLKQDFTKVFVGFDKKPRIWKKTLN